MLFSTKKLFINTMFMMMLYHHHVSSSSSSIQSMEYDNNDNHNEYNSKYLRISNDELAEDIQKIKPNNKELKDNLSLQITLEKNGITTIHSALVQSHHHHHHHHNSIIILNSNDDSNNSSSSFYGSSNKKDNDPSSSFPQMEEYKHNEKQQEDLVEEMKSRDDAFSNYDENSKYDLHESIIVPTPSQIPSLPSNESSLENRAALVEDTINEEQQQTEDTEEVQHMYPDFPKTKHLQVLDGISTTICVLAIVIILVNVALLVTKKNHQKNKSLI